MTIGVISNNLVRNERMSMRNISQLCGRECDVGVVLRVRMIMRCACGACACECVRVREACACVGCGACACGGCDGWCV